MCLKSEVKVGCWSRHDRLSALGCLLLVDVRRVAGTDAAGEIRQLIKDATASDGGRVGWGKTILGQLMRFKRMGISVVRLPWRRNITHYGFPGLSADFKCIC